VGGRSHRLLAHLALVHVTRRLVEVGQRNRLKFLDSVLVLIKRLL